MGGSSGLEPGHAPFDRRAEEPEHILGGVSRGAGPIEIGADDRGWNLPVQAPI